MAQELTGRRIGVGTTSPILNVYEIPMKENDPAEAIGAFREILGEIAEGGPNTSEAANYQELRKRITQDDRIAQALPLFVSECRSARDFWDHIRSLKTYEDRARHIRDQLLPLERQLRAQTMTGRAQTSDDRKARGMDWSIIHIDIQAVSRKKFEDGHCADAVESAFKEVNNRVKEAARDKRSGDYLKDKHGNELDGAYLMHSCFSINNPLICLSPMKSASDQDEQKGYMQIFAGSMTGIRNPKAHENLVIDENRGAHLIYLASLLMYKLDEANVPCMTRVTPVGKSRRIHRLRNLQDDLRKPTGRNFSGDH